MTAPQIFGIAIDLVCVLLVVLMLISGWNMGFVSMLVRLLSVAAGAVGGFLGILLISLCFSVEHLCLLAVFINSSRIESFKIHIFSS